MTLTQLIQYLKMSKLPKHRTLMIESLELLFAGNKTAAKKKLAKAKTEVNKFYSLKSKTK
jgi:hypothetical protein